MAWMAATVSRIMDDGDVELGLEPVDKVVGGVAGDGQHGAPPPPTVWPRPGGGIDRLRLVWGVPRIPAVRSGIFASLPDEHPQVLLVGFSLGAVNDPLVKVLVAWGPMPPGRLGCLPVVLSWEKPSLPLAGTRWVLPLLLWRRGAPRGARLPGGVPISPEKWGERGPGASPLDPRVFMAARCHSLVFGAGVFGAFEGAIASDILTPIWDAFFEKYAEKNFMQESLQIRVRTWGS